MKKYVKIGSLVLMILVLCIAYAHINKMHPIFNVDVDPGTYIGTAVGASEEFEQIFVSQEKSIDGVAVKFATTGENLEAVQLVYSIEDENGQVLGDGVLKGSNFKNQKYNQLKVKRIEDAEGKVFIFKCHMENNDDTNGISFYQESDNLIMKYYMTRFDAETFLVAFALCLYVVVFMKILFKMFKE